MPAACLLCHGNEMMGAALCVALHRGLDLHEHAADSPSGDTSRTSGRTICSHCHVVPAVTGSNTTLSKETF
eukprot:m.181136 g.181136  ORF g.181136 m.181136 type:complete len:71 (+) comp18441_c0_seq15:1873-2085(+)